MLILHYRYVETGQYVHRIKPWVWIVVLSLGAFLHTMVSTHSLKASVSSFRQATAGTEGSQTYSHARWFLQKVL